MTSPNRRATIGGPSDVDFDKTGTGVHSYRCGCRPSQSKHHMLRLAQRERFRGVAGFQSPGRLRVQVPRRSQHPIKSRIPGLINQGVRPHTAGSPSGMAPGSKPRNSGSSILSPATSPERAVVLRGSLREKAAATASRDDGWFKPIPSQQVVASPNPSNCSCLMFSPF